MSLVLDYRDYYGKREWTVKEKYGPGDLSNALINYTTKAAAKRAQKQLRTAKKKNAGVRSIRKTKKRLRGLVQKGHSGLKELAQRMRRPRKREKANPASALPVGRFVTVKARRRPDGQIDLFRRCPLFPQYVPYS